MVKKSILAGLAVLASIVATPIASHIVAPSVAHAQGMEYCPDLGVFVQHVNGGMQIRAMRRDSIVRQLGLRPGDLIFGVDGRHPDSINELHAMLFAGADNVDHDLDILRGPAHLHAAIFHQSGRVFVHVALH